MILQRETSYLPGVINQESKTILALTQHTLCWGHMEHGQHTQMYTYMYTKVHIKTIRPHIYTQRPLFKTIYIHKDDEDLAPALRPFMV